MKYLFLMLLLCGCAEQTELKIKKISERNDGKCNYYLGGHAVYFTDSCGKYNIGDTLK